VRSGKISLLWAEIRWRFPVLISFLTKTCSRYLLFPFLPFSAQEFLHSRYLRWSEQVISLSPFDAVDVPIRRVFWFSSRNTPLPPSRVELFFFFLSFSPGASVFRRSPFQHARFSPPFPRGLYLLDDHAHLAVRRSPIFLLRFFRLHCLNFLFFCLLRFAGVSPLDLPS